MSNFLRLVASWMTKSRFPFRPILIGLAGVAGLLIIAISGILFAFLRAAPDQSVEYNLDKPAVSFIAIGDQGTGNYRQWQVAQGMRHLSQNNPLDFVILMGDNFYRYGVQDIHDRQWLYKFENMYRGGKLEQVPFYAVLGNHDYGGNEEAEINYSHDHMGSGRWHMPAKDYVEYYGRAAGESLLKVIYLDTSPGARTRENTATKLNAMLASSKPAIWTIVTTHVPVRTSRKHYFDQHLVDLMMPILKRYQVDAYYSGHDHNQQLISRPGEPLFIIAGTGGKHGAKLDAGFEPNLDFSTLSTGFVYTTLTEKSLTISFYNSESKLLYQTERDKPRQLSNRSLINNQQIAGIKLSE